MNSKKQRGLLPSHSSAVEKKASKKGCHGENKVAPDRISSLPDCVLCHILSFIPTKYAVGTSVLSTRWKTLFVSVPVLDFDDSLTMKTPSPLTNSSFSNFVRRVLSLHNVMCIPRFSLICVDYDYEPSDVCSWIRAAVARNIQEVEVATCLMRGGSLPRELLECKSLVVLKICGEFEIPLSDFVCLPLLKTLHLVHMSLSLEDTTWSVSSHFPALEDLLLECFKACGKVADISIPSLKRLELIEVRKCSRIVLDAPALEYLNYTGTAAVGFSGSGMNSLVKAQIDILIDMGIEVGPWESPEEIAEFPNFVNMLHNVQFLTLSDSTLKAIQDSNCSLPTFHNLIRLEITDSGYSRWQAVSNLLERSPFLQYLVFGDGLPKIDAEYNSDADEEPVLPAGAFFDVDGLPSGEHLCLSSSMKEIEIKNFRGFYDEYTICEYFLKKAKVLDKLIVHYSNEWAKTHVETSQKILAFPRSSATCQVELIEVYEET